MKATEILIEEHQVITRVLDALESAADNAAQGQAVSPAFFIDAAEFIKGFADGCHHRKEENVLFKAMAESGVPVQGGPVGVMLYEHEQGRQLTATMRQAAIRWQAGDESARPAVIQAARGYVALLRQHIAKENGVLFPMADRVIPLEGQAKVADDFEHIEHEETGEGVHEKYLALAESLEMQVAST
jgi:hemerythrin-like domain-containing protein